MSLAPQADVPLSDAVPTDVPADTGTDAALDVATTVAPCGDAACTPTQLCFTLYASGNDGECVTLTTFDADVCPAGWRLRTDGCHGPSNGCVPPRCHAYDPACGDVPAECQANPGCGCFASDPCQPAGRCATVTGGQVVCTCI